MFKDGKEVPLCTSTDYFSAEACFKATYAIVVKCKGGVFVYIDSPPLYRDYSHIADARGQCVEATQFICRLRQWENQGDTDEWGFVKLLRNVKLNL